MTDDIAPADVTVTGAGIAGIHEPMVPTKEEWGPCMSIDPERGRHAHAARAGPACPPPPRDQPDP